MNKIVPMKKESYERIKMTKEAYEKTRQEYNKINKHFKGKIDKDGNAYIVDGESILQQVIEKTVEEENIK